MLRIVNKYKSQPLFIFLIISIPVFFFFIIRSEEYFYPLASDYSDLTITHLPNLIYLKDSIRNFGQIPFWSDQILSGYPFIANPLSGIWYLPIWFILFLPQPLGFNLLFFAHLLFGGAGLLKYLKLSGKNSMSSITGALIFILLPKIFAHYALGHVTLVFAVCWTPWLLVAEFLRLSSEAGKISKIGTGLILGVILFADVRWGAYSAIFIFLYSLSHILNRLFVGEKRKINIFSKISLKRFSHWLVLIVFQVLISILIAAPMLLPMSQFTARSTRSTLSTQDNLFLSLSPEKLLGFFFPDLGAYAEWVVYAGSIFIMVLLCSLFLKKFRKGTLFWVFLFVITTTYALGDNFFFNKIVSSFPGMSLLRVPGRSIFLSGLSAAVLAANFLDVLTKRNVSPVETKRINLLFAAVFLFEVIINGAVILLTKEFPVEFLWGLSFFLIGFLLLRVFIKTRSGFWISSLVLLILIDLGAVNYLSINFRSQCEVNSEGAESAVYLGAQSGTFRVYSPSYSIPQLTASIFNLELADGIDPLQLIDYAVYFEKASGVPQEGYSVTMPPFHNGDPKTSNLEFTPDAQLLGKLNVRYIVSTFPINTDLLKLVKETSTDYIYENTMFLPRAWVQDEDKNAGEGIISIPAIQISPNEIIVEAEGPGQLVLSEINYPGWKAEVNGEDARLDGKEIFRFIMLNEGKNSVRIYYRPIFTIIGLMISIVTMSVLIFTTWVSRNK